MLEPGITLASRYRIGDVIAHSGTAVVVQAEDERLGRPVAIKTVRTDDPELVHRLRREARHLARLSHPNIVRLFDVVEHDGQPCLVTQLVEGRPLRALRGQLSGERVAWIGEHIASACAAAHAVGIVHRDLEPSNVLVGDDALHLLGFGIARNIDDTTMTDVDSIVGTASYISPEQLRGRPALPAADIYALGLVLIECLTGRAACSATSADSVATRLLSPPRLDAVPAAWHQLLQRMTAVEPADRPDARAVAGELGRLRRSLAADTSSTASAATVAGVRTGAPTGAPVAAAVAHPSPDLEGAAPPGPRPRRPLRARLAVPTAVAAGFLSVAGLGAALTGPPEPLASTEVAAAMPVTTPPTLPPPPLASPATTTVAPPTTAPPTTTPPTTAPAPAPVAVTPTTLDAATVRELQRMAEAQRKQEARDLEALQDDFQERLEQYVRQQTGRGKGRDKD